MLDIKKLKEIQKELDKRVEEEYFQNVQRSFIELLSNPKLISELSGDKRIRELTQSSRVLNNWEKKGIIDSGREDKNQWRKFSTLEAIWLNLVDVLREFGLSLTAVAKIKSKLFDHEGSKVIPLQYALLHSILREPIILVIFSNGTVLLQPLEVYKEMIGKITYPHIAVNVLDIAKKEFPHNSFESVSLNEKKELSEKELILLYYLRTGKYEWIKLRMKNDEIYLIEGQKKFNSKSRMTDIINNSEFQSIEIMTEDKEIKKISVTEKFKI